MGCAPTKPVVPLYESEKKRPGVPGRVEVPNGKGGWTCGTINTQLEVDSAFRVRVDNFGQGPLLNVVLRRPIDLISFNNFREDGEEEEDYDTMMKRLPTRPGDPIDVIVLGDSNPDHRKVRGRVGSAHSYEGGERILVLLQPYDESVKQARLVDATVIGPPVNAGAGAHFKVRTIHAGKRPAETSVDLNDFNHCVQRFEDAKAYEDARVAYLHVLMDSLSTVEDAITVRL